MQPDRRRTTALHYWEDIVNAGPRRFGPVVIRSELLDQLLDILGERHPIHDDEGFAHSTARRGRIVPGGFLHSITSGWIVRHGGAAAVVGLRSVSWDFLRPIYPDMAFFFTNESVAHEAVDERMGLVNTVRRIFDEKDQLRAIGRMNTLILRRPAPSVEATNHA